MPEKPNKAGIDVFVRREDIVACLYGRIDIDSSPTVRDRLLGLMRPPYPKLVTIDLSEITHIDSSGLATLIEALKIARTHKTEMRLHGLQDRLLRFLMISGILSLFDGEYRNVSEPENEVV